MPFDTALATRLRSALAATPGITERRMFGGLAFLKDGRMCCGVVGDDLVVRVLDAAMPTALEHPHVRPMDFTGRPMRGFVYVSSAGLKTSQHLRRWVSEGLRYVAECPQSTHRPKAPSAR